MQRRYSFILFLVLIFSGLFSAVAEAATQRWSEQEIRHWYASQRWIVGSNYIPASAVNQLEMWQADTFDPQRIDLELGWAEGLGMNTMRVFLHDLLWEQDPEGFKQRINIFLDIAQRHHIRPIFVFFDSCWNPDPHLGKQDDPIPGVHNSRWVKSPGKTKLLNLFAEDQLKNYVTGIIGAFAHDSRILAWDMWNEPDNIEYGQIRIRFLLPKIFSWARSANPSQPLTSGIMRNLSSLSQLNDVERVQLQNSDLVSFHSYSSPDQFEKTVLVLQQLHRPIICTEYMARKNGSTFQNILPITKKYNVGAINWGFVRGKTQTIFPWDSWEHPYIEDPALWFHDIFWSDGTPYLPDETQFIHNISKE